MGSGQRRGMAFIVSIEKQNLFSIAALVNNLILLLASNNILRKQQRKFQENRAFLLIFFQKLPIVFQSPSIRDKITNPFPSLLTSNNQATTGKLDSLVHNKSCLHSKECCKHQCICFQDILPRLTTSQSTERRKARDRKEIKTLSPGLAQLECLPVFPVLSSQPLAVPKTS